MHARTDQKVFTNKRFGTACLQPFDSDENSNGGLKGEESPFCNGRMSLCWMLCVEIQSTDLRPFNSGRAAQIALHNKQI